MLGPSFEDCPASHDSQPMRWGPASRSWSRDNPICDRGARRRPRCIFPRSEHVGYAVFRAGSFHLEDEYLSESSPILQVRATSIRIQRILPVNIYILKGWVFRMFHLGENP